MSDPAKSKVNQLFDKINSNNIEIEERSIKNIAQKVQLGLVTSADLATHSAHQIGYLLQWINNRYSHATTACLLASFSILQHLTQCQEGRSLLQEHGAVTFLRTIAQDCQDDAQKESIATIIAAMVNEPQLNPFQSMQQSVRSMHDTLNETVNLNQTQGLNQTKNSAARHGFTTKTTFNVQSIQSPVTKVAELSTTEQLHSAHIEILHKNQCLKEVCELPFVTLSDHDEKIIFDLSVQLKFGDFRTVLNACSQIDLVLQDFPVEVLLQRTDTIKALLDLLEGGSGGQTALSNLAQQQLLLLVRRLRQLYRFNTNNLTKKSTGQPQSEYLQMSYPSCKETSWNTMETVSDLRKYGASLPSEKLAAASLQGSLSCKAVLGLILTKSVYLLKDTEKVGLYVQLIKECWQTVTQLYEINVEMTELLHLVLFAFDSVCEFYRDQLFEEVLIAPILDLALTFVKNLCSISQDGPDRFKQPFSETFFKNTEKMQMTLRRGLFTLQLTEPQSSTILGFFDRMENDLASINLLQKQVSLSYYKALEANKRFNKVHHYKLPGTNYEDMCFVDSMPQLTSALDILETLTGCIQMKVEFPFEHLLLDCAVYSSLLQEQGSDTKTIEIVEKLFITYMSTPVSEIRERILRRLFQRIRLVQAFQQSQKYKCNNSYLLAKFVYRKRILHQLINGTLINSEVAQEMTRLQIDVGTVVVKILVVAYTETGFKSSNLNSFLLTFQSLMPKYPDLLALVDLIEEPQPQARYTRLLRDIFSKQQSKREFSTQILQSQISKDQVCADLLQSVTDLKDPSSEMSSELDLINLQYDFTQFDTQNILTILMNARSDFTLRKSSLEQLTMLLFDQSKRAKQLFTNTGVTNLFTFATQELLSAYNTAKTYLQELVQELPLAQLQYIEHCFKFIVYSFIFYPDEAVIKQFKSDDLLTACVFFTGSHQMRKQALRLIFTIVFSPVLLKTKISKDKRSTVTLLVPDFFVPTYHMLVPTTIQIVRQPMRDDLILSEEQKDYIMAVQRCTEKRQEDNQVLLQVGDQFVETNLDNYHNLMTTYQTLQNYLLAVGGGVIQPDVLTRVQELLRMLPTKDFEFSFLADYLMFTNQILTVVSNLDDQLEPFVRAICQGLKYHMLPFLYETRFNGLDHTLFTGQFLDLLINLSQADTFFKNKLRCSSSFMLDVLSPSLTAYLTDLFAIMKDCNTHRHKILVFFNIVLVNYDTKALVLDKVPNMLIGAIQQHRMSHSFQGNASVMVATKMLIWVYSQRLSHKKEQDLKPNQFLPLSQTTNKVLLDFQSSGWVSRFTESRDARLRCLAWDLLTHLFDYAFFKQNQSIVHQALQQLLSEGELYCVQLSILTFVNKLCECLINTSNHGDDDIQLVLSIISKQGFVSQIHSVIGNKECPLLMVQQLLKFVSSLVQIDYKRTLPILTQLDYWTVLVDMINIESLVRQEDRESRSIVIQMRHSVLKQTPVKLDVIYTCLNGVLEFIFQAMKKDSQLANLLVKTTKLMPYLFRVLTQTLNTTEPSLQGQFLLTVEKCVKIMHLALLHPRDHTLQLLQGFIETNTDGTYGWSFIIKMFDLVSQRASVYYYGHVDVKLAISRFVAEYLLRVQQANLKHNLDQMIAKYELNGDLTAYGGQLLMEFGKVFRALYTDQRDSRQQQGVPHEMLDHENSKIDICLSLSILVAASQAAKVQAVEQNLVKKVIEICEENVEALHLSELQKLANKSIKQQPPKVQDYSRKFKYASLDSESAEREIIRMLGVVKHVLYNSAGLLQNLLFAEQEQTFQKSFVSQNATKKKKKDVVVGDLIVSLFGAILFMLPQTSIIEECLQTMTTMASQNKKCKNAFLSASQSLIGSKRNTVMKVVNDFVLREPLQSNTKRMHLLFAFLRSACLSAEVVREIGKSRMIEDIQANLEINCKNEKDIKLIKNYLLHYSGFLAAFAYSEEGVKTIIGIKQVFTMSLFVIDTVSPPPELTVISNLVLNLLTFLRNASLNRVGKQHFISDKAFLLCLMAFLSERQQHAKIRAATAACLWTVLFNHQGVKAELNNDNVKRELMLLQNEYQRTCDISKYASYVTSNAEKGNDACAFDVVDDSPERAMDEVRRMEHFTLVALTGIIALMEN